MLESPEEWVTRIPTRIVFAALLATALIVDPAAAVLIAAENQDAATRPPRDDPGWRYVAVRKGLSVIYLGRGWMLTAAHVRRGPVSIGGEIYLPLYGSARLLRNPDSTPSDLLLFRIAGDPGLPVLPLATQTPGIGTEVVMIGGGQDRGPAILGQDASGERELLGWRWATTRRKRWGTNVIDENRYALHTAGSTTRTLAMDFSRDATRASEAHAVSGDSGGALFVKRAGIWELAGVLLATSSRLRLASMFGDVTLAADVASYRDQILAATAIRDVSSRPMERFVRRLRSGLRSLVPRPLVRAH